MDNTVRIKHPYRGHHYVLQNVLILQAIQMTLYTMENSSPYVGDSAPTFNRHKATAFAGRYIMLVLTLSLRSVNETGP